MRVISGTARGKRLEAPAGEKTRPTADKLKETIFNIIQFDIAGRSVLDLFAGSGQLGIEALSRGAESAVFVDDRLDSIRVIQKNLENVRFTDRARVIRSDYADYMRTVRAGSFGLVFMDPPYGGGWLKKALGYAAAFDILKTGGIIICESAAEDDLGILEAPYQVRKIYRYGPKKVTVVTKERA